MSVINKVLRDLDRREAETRPADATGQVKVAEPAARHGRLFAVIALAVIAIGAGLWAWKARPTKSVNEKAFQPLPAKKQALPAPPPGGTAARPAPPPAAQSPAPAASQSPPAAAPKTEASVPADSAASKTAKAPKATPPARPVARSRAGKQRTATAQSKSTAQYEHAVELLNDGRVSEALQELFGVMRAEPSYVPARQAYVALLLEQGRVDSAQQALVEALSSDPAEPTFALGLARIYAAKRDYPAALEVMDRAGAAGAGPDLQSLRGLVLQRMGRYPEAIEAYRKAIAAGAPAATDWMGLAISLERSGRREEATDAYRHALAAQPSSRELRDYAEERARELQ